MSVVIKNIKKKFRNAVVLDDISFRVNEGEFLALLGPSGSGKTTLLRIIAGLEHQDDGEIFLEGLDATNKPIKERKIGFVFQHFALFKHMNIFENIAFGLRLKRLSEEIIRSKVEQLLHLVHLDGSSNKFPSELSGGQRQRVALARVLAVEPRYMLLDEPFGALDAKVRQELRRWLKKLHDATGLTTLFVTHDQEEAMELSDRIAILNEGKLEQIGTPLELWENPANAFVFDFLGNYNTFYGVRTADGELLLQESGGIKVFSRPHEAVLEREPNNRALFLPVQPIFINRASPLIKIELEDRNGTFYQVDMEKSAFESLNFKVGEKLWLRPVKYYSFEEKAGRGSGFY